MSLFMLLLLVIAATVYSELAVPAGVGKCANDSHYNEFLASRLRHEFLQDQARSKLGFGWMVRHPSLTELYRKHQCHVCIEIGIARGELVHSFVAAVPEVTEYHAVDPFLGGYDPRDVTSIELKKFNEENKNTPETWADAVLYNLRDFGCKVRLHLGMSADMVSRFKPKSVDCIFIDGDHTYEGVQKDIHLYGPIAKPGGILVFDDYVGGFPGVVKAVDELVTGNSAGGLKLEHVNKHGNVMVAVPSDSASYSKVVF